MKKVSLLLGFFVLVGSIVIGWGPISEVGAQIVKYFTTDPDMGPFTRAKTGMTKEEFMLKRAEAIGLRRGLQKDNLFEPQRRIDAIHEMARQEELARSVAPQAAWTEIGPNPIPNGQTDIGAQLAVSGRTTTIAVHPTNPDIAYVGTAQGGLYRTLNGGTTWTPMLDSALSLAIGAVAIAPSQPDTIYVGTGEPNFSLDSFFGVGIYRIDNASSGAPVVTGPLNKTAGNVDIFTGASISEVAVSSTDPNIIFVSTTFGLGGIGGTFPTSPAFGLYRSTNAAGVAPTFAKIDVFAGNNPFLNITDVVIDPGDNNRVVCVTGDAFGVAAAGQRGIYRTTNALAGTPTFALTQALNTFDRTELAITRIAGVVTVYAASGFNGGTVHRSINGGDSFTQQVDNNFCTPQCFYNVAVAVDPTNADIVYVGGAPSTNGLIFSRSTNAGVTFPNDSVNTVSGLHVDTHAIAVAPSNPAIVYFGSDGGIYRTTDAAATPIVWNTLNNTTFRATQFMSVAVHPIDPNFSIGGTQDNGTNYYTPGATWTRSDFGDGGYAVIDQGSLNNVAVNMYHTYFSNGGLNGYAYAAGPATATEGTWLNRGCFNGVSGGGITCTSNVLFYAPLEHGPGTPNTIYYGNNVLNRSDNLGVLSSPVSQSFGTDPISAIGISPTNDNVRMVGTSGGQIFGTTTGANPLVNMDPGGAIPNNFVARTVIDPNNVNTAYVTLSAYGVNTIFKTTTLSSLADGIAPTWTSIQNGLPQIPMSAFVVDPLNSNNIYVGTDIGVFFSTNAGNSWLPLGTGLPRVAVFDMAIAPGSNLRIATHGRGMWQVAIAPPVAANASISGRVLIADGRGLNGAAVILTDSSGESRMVRTGSFGYYRIDDIPTGQTYIISVGSKRYQFTPRSISLGEDVADFDFVAN